MLLETGNDVIRFKPTPIEGADKPDLKKPDFLILDGQQRITSLYQTIITEDIVKTRNDKGYKIERWYYIDMQKAMDPEIDLEEAIISVNEKKQITANIGREIVLDLSQEEFEFQNMMFPVKSVDLADFMKWRNSYNKYWNFTPEKIEFCDNFTTKIIMSFQQYMLPVIVMKKENPKEAVCQVFEKVNTGGVSLTVFELLTATFAADGYELKEKWDKTRKEFDSYSNLNNTQNTDFIQAITLLSKYKKRIAYTEANPGGIDLPAVSCKRKDMLNLTLDEFESCYEDIKKGFIKSAKILVENHIYTARDLPYNTQLIPLSAILAVIGNHIDNAGNKNKLMQWFWCGVLGELYGSANETRYGLDLPQVVDWIQYNGVQPNTIYDSNFAPTRLNTLRTRNSAAYKGIYALLMDEGTRDWLTNTKIDLISYFSESIDIHHIFPKAWCEKKGIPAEKFDSIINKTPLSGGTNKFVSGDAPSKYLDRLLKKAGISSDELQPILESHVLKSEYLLSDDFEGFINSRKELILQRIERATGKTIPRDETLVEEGEYEDNEIEINSIRDEEVTLTE
jgi:hypothetical protein